MKNSTITLSLAILLALATIGHAQETNEIGIDEQLGAKISLGELTFLDEQGQPVKLESLFDRPVVLTLVYYRCPGICTPLLNELTRAVDHCDLVPGKDYRLVTISFDPEETAELARQKRENMLAQLKNVTVSPDQWRFLTGDAENIRRLTEEVGFRYAPDQNGVDYIHAATVVFLSPDGMIARYLNGLKFNPADLKMAVIDASEGRARSFMQRMQRLCYSYDPKGRAYALNINRIILAVTLGFAGTFALVLFVRGKTRSGDAK